MDGNHLIKGELNFKVRSRIVFRGATHLGEGPFYLECEVPRDNIADEWEREETRNRILVFYASLSPDNTPEEVIFEDEPDF